jgi:hypothetical protein
VALRSLAANRLALAGTVGSALVAGIAQDGVVAESVDAYGDTMASAREAISLPARPGQVTGALLGAAAQAQRQAGQPTRLAVVSAADPVERGSAASLDDAGSLDDFAYVFLGEGLGCAIVSGGEVSRGCAGLAGEIALIITVGPRGRPPA